MRSRQGTTSRSVALARRLESGRVPERARKAAEPAREAPTSRTVYAMRPVRRRPSLAPLLFVTCALYGCGGGAGATGGDTSTLDASTGDALADGSGLDAPATPETDGVAADTPTDAPPFDAAGEPPLTTKTFTLSTDAFLNPERGWMQGDGFALSPTEDLSAIRGAGYSVLYGDVRLDAFRTVKTLTPKFLADLGGGFAKVRAAKLKVVLRFTYNDPNAGSTQDAAVDVVLEHVRQLGDVVKANADVVAVWQAGFIGQWGEWHDSTSGLDTPANRKKVLDAIVAALPPGISTQIRTPMFKAEQFPSALVDAQAFDGSAQARIGHHNDCFLADASDMGTYDAPIDTWKAYVQSDARFTPMGGETCALFPARTDCAPAMAESKRLHWSFMNDHWSDKVVAAWKAQGCYADIGSHLGYRLGLTEARYSSNVRPGGVLQVRLTLANEGYAAPFNPRPVFLTLDDGTTQQRARLAAIDPRRFTPGAISVITARLRIPASAKPGSYKLALWMPDPAAGLQAIPEYSIRLANAGAWDAAKGLNLVTDTLTIDAAAAGAVDPSATAFVELP
jgi:hypothetical protein